MCPSTLEGCGAADKCGRMWKRSLRQRRSERHQPSRDSHVAGNRASVVARCVKTRARPRRVNVPRFVLKDVSHVMSFRTRSEGAEPGLQLTGKSGRCRFGRHRPCCESLEDNGEGGIRGGAERARASERPEASGRASAGALCPSTLEGRKTLPVFEFSGGFRV